MKENKPILFINSATTNNFYQKNQEVYDSRRKNNIPKPKKKSQVPEITSEPENINTNVEEFKEKNTEFMEEQTVFNEDTEGTEQETYQEVENEPTPVEITQPEEDPQIERPFANKIRLLTKRALLNRYVLVAIVLQDGEIEGLFKGSNNENIILEVNNEDNEISQDEIEDIRIIRV